jgi:hypothetical protein
VNVRPRIMLAAATATALCGCTGSGRVLLAALDYQAIDPPAGAPPRFFPLDMDRCFWWTDEHGHVWVAMDCDQPLFLGTNWRFKFRLSLALDQPPAGSTRDYAVAKRELRATAQGGPLRSRYASVRGIVALYREPNEHLRGSFRLEVAREVQQMLGGWGNASRYLMMGTFDAVRDETRGPQIAAQTETPGREREPPATQPTQ